MYYDGGFWMIYFLFILACMCSSMHAWCTLFLPGGVPPPLLDGCWIRTCMHGLLWVHRERERGRQPPRDNTRALALPCTIEMRSSRYTDGERWDESGSSARVIIIIYVVAKSLRAPWLMWLLIYIFQLVWLVGKGKSAMRERAKHLSVRARFLGNNSCVCGRPRGRRESIFAPPRIRWLFTFVRCARV